MTTFDVALMIVTDGESRPVVATVSEQTRVGDLVAAAGGSPSTSVARLGERLDPAATLGDAGVCAGDTLQLGETLAGDWKRLGPELRVVGGAEAGRRQRVTERPIVVGRSDEAGFVLHSNTVSRRHAELCWTGDGFTVRDLGSRHGTFIDGRRIDQNEIVEVPAHGAVQLGDSVVTISGGAEPVSTTHRRSEARDVVPRDTSPPRRSSMPYLVPSAGALALAAAAGGAPTILAIAATPAALLAGLGADRLLGQRSERRAANAHADELREFAEEMRVEASSLARSARARCPDPATLLGFAERRSPSLWSLAPSDLMLRVGLVTLDDAVSVRADEVDRRALAGAGAAHLTPAIVALGHASVTVAGPESFLDDLFDWLVVQAVVLCSPDDVELLVVSDDVDRWAWTALLPHSRSRVVLTSAAAAQGLPTPERQRRLLVLDRCRVPGSGPGDVLLLRSEAAGVGRRDAGTLVTAIAPNRVAIDGTDASHADVLADVLDDPPATVLSFAMHLAALGSQGRSGLAVPARVRLPDVISGATDALAIARGWRRPSDTLVAVIGADEAGPVAVTLEGASSHMLVAGTTGAGKTRLLETLVLGLAANYSPASVNVMVIDFKGGNELAGLTRLPHCVGAVSDREPAEVDRAIAALTRELARRDELFAAARATDRADYVAKTGFPLPRLVVVADEFGQFRREDAAGTRVAALLRIAAQGRSKGVHLVLATQSPSVDVTSEIRQNVGVRLCLRVAEPAESVAVLGTTDAAQLVQPGRVVVSDGDRTRIAQVALSRGPTMVTETAQQSVIVRDLIDVAAGRAAPNLELPAELFDAIVEAVAIAATADEYDVAELLGPSLPSRVQRSALPGAQSAWTSGGLVLAQRDRPGVPSAPPLAFEPHRVGSCTIVGGPRSGRTTALLAIAEAARHQTDVAHPVVVHAIDWSGGLDVLSGAAGDGGVVAYRDFEHLRRTLRWLSGDGIDGTTRLVLVDRLDALLRDLRDLDGGALATELSDALQNGPRRGVFAAVTVDPVSLISGGPQLGGLRLVLPVEDPSLVTAAGLPRRSIALPGRAVALPDGDDVQVGLPQSPERGAPAGGHVGPMPNRVDVASLAPLTGERALIGLGGDDVLSSLAIDLDRVGPLVVVIGRAGSGRSTALDTLERTYAGGRSTVRIGGRTASDWSVANAPSLLLVDDAVRAGALHPWLNDAELADALRAGGHVLVASFDQADLHALGYGHWLMRRPCPGLLLALDATSDRMVAGERVGFHPPAELRAGPPGRGWWCERGRGTPVQVAQL